MEEAIAHRGPDGRGHHLDEGDRARSTAGWRSSTSPAGAPADGRTSAATRHHLQRRDLQLRRVARASSRPAATASAPTPTPRSRFTPTRSGARRRSSGSTACSAWRSGTPASARCSSPVTATGSSPLYYAQVGSTFLFGSEIKAMLQHPALEVRVSLPHVLEYFTFQNIFTDGTLFEGVRLLPPGHHMTIAANGAQLAPPSLLGFQLSRGSDHGIRRGARRGTRPPVPPGRPAPARR